MADGESKSGPAGVSVYQFSEINPEMRRDPHVLLDAQRALAPAARDPMLHAVLITSHELARDLLTDRRYSRNFDLAAPENFVIAGVRELNAAVEPEFGKHDSMLILEDPDHARVRGLIAKAFLARAAESRGLIERVVDDLLGALDGREGFDVVSDYACRIPIHVLGPILGCDAAMLDQLRVWTEAGQTAFDPERLAESRAEAIEGRRGILSYFRDLMAARRAEPRDDLVSDLLAMQREGAALSDGEILHNLFALLVAGHLTTADLIGNGVYLLLTHAEARDQILAEPAKIGPAVDEILRFEPPISTTARFVDEGGVIGGCPFQKGDALGVSLLGANRDSAAFETPHKFDIARRPNPHLSFGAGAHMCVGAPLARMEGQEAILRLLQRFPTMRLAKPDAAPDWRAVAGIRGLNRLDVLIS